MTTAISTNDQLAGLGVFLGKKRANLVDIAPKGTDVDRIIKLAIIEAAKNERLVQCSPVSIYLALAKACELNLVAGGSLSRASLIPMWSSKSKCYHAELIIQYTGLMDLARRSGTIAHFVARVVHENDDFEHSFDLEKGDILKHTVNYDDPGKPRLVYAVVFNKDGSKQVEVMTTAQVNKIRANSRSGKSGPWVDHWGEMARKTVIRRMCKWLPKTPELMAVLEHDIRTDFGDDIDVDEILSGHQGEGDDNGTIEQKVIEVKPEEPPKDAPKKRVKNLVKKAKENNLPEPETDFTE